MDKLQDKLRNYNIQPGAEVWQRIEQSLEKEKSQKTTLYYRRYAAVAAAAVMAIFVLLFSKENDNQSTSLVKLSHENNSLSSAKVEEDVKIQKRVKEKAQGVTEIVAIVKPEVETKLPSNDLSIPKAIGSSDRKIVNPNERIAMEESLQSLPIGIKPLEIKANQNIPSLTASAIVSETHESRIQLKWLKLLSEELSEEQDSTFTERLLDLANKKSISIFESNVKPVIYKWYNRH